MNKEFVPYEQALELKKLGFDEPCFGYYTGDKKHLLLRPNMGRMNDPSDDVPTASTFSQVFRWFREKYKISGEISSDFYLEGKDNEWEYNIYQLDKEDDGYDGTIPIYKTYEEAELECLKKLIEIVKNGK